jgi:hypothetical protein
LAKLLFINARVSPHTIWNAMESHLRKIGTIVALNPGEKMMEDGVFGVESTLSQDVIDEGLEEIMRELP